MDHLLLELLLLLEHLLEEKIRVVLLVDGSFVEGRGWNRREVGEFWRLFRLLCWLLIWLLFAIDGSFVDSWRRSWEIREFRRLFWLLFWSVDDDDVLKDRSRFRF